MVRWHLAEKGIQSKKEVPRKGVSWYCAVWDLSFCHGNFWMSCCLWKGSHCWSHKNSAQLFSRWYKGHTDWQFLLWDELWLKARTSKKLFSCRTCATALPLLGKTMRCYGFIVISKRYEELIRGYLAPQAVAALRLGRSVSSSASCCLILSWAASNALEGSQIKNQYGCLEPRAPPNLLQMSGKPLDF